MKVRDRITDHHLAQWTNRLITTRTLANTLGTHENYLGRILRELTENSPKLPGKTPKEREKAAKLSKNRRQIRDDYAKQVIKNKIDIEWAAQQCGCSIRTMYRHVKAYKR